MSFIIYDITFLILFIIFVSIFLYNNKKNIKKEGPFFLYKTSWGIKLINYIGGKYKKTLKFLSYVSISLGYFLMATMMFLIIQTIYLYLTTNIATVVKAPPLMPLIPYFPRLFGVESLFPPFFFAYFIISILIIATVHEFAHGIFARSYNIKIKSTGFAFLRYFPALFGAFVEQDEKQMNKANRFEQKSILSAGVFANTITAILFYIIFFWFFTLAFTPSGIIFNDYQYSIVEISSISMINGIQLNNFSQENIANLINKTGFNEIKVDEKNYVGIKGFPVNNNEHIALYDDSPAINAKLNGAIIAINNEKINSLDDFKYELLRYSPGEKITIKTKTDIEENYEIVLGENPQEKDLSFLGIAFIDRKRTGITGKLFNAFSSFKKPNIYYEPKSDSSIFIKDLLWWIIVINILVALFNMLPLGFLDGGRFFYLTILGITKSEKIAKKSFAVLTYFILFLFILLMIKWAFSFW
ncbi:MAG: site-2 protease family protein [Candidatus Pacearchaeota archaeon]|jgi:membrane-associated protease RseP (regulator of RpoE activity)|nr:site-2 protease family protein [Candidatus Pacearchaeota archaeon]|tara:strand:+ start:12745 stop:14154 length:1410 start_codon:yes stop_codon:yes gene_type:complete